MKKILFVALLTLPLFLSAKDKTDAKYLRGAVPEVNGIVTFTKTFSVPGKSKADIYEVMYRFMQDSILAKGIKGERNSFVSDGKEDGIIVVRNEEYMTFKKLFLNLDRTRFRYNLAATVTDGKVSMMLSKITYYYNEDMDGQHGENYKAEEWITDKEAVNKSNTKLYPRSGKFRIKTIDRVEAIVESAMDAFEEQSVQPAKKRRTATVVE